MCLSNPYLTALEAWFDPAPGNTVGDAGIDEQLLANLRQNLVLAFAWGIPGVDALETVAGDDERILEIGAGTGYWSWCLRQLGYDVVATDAKQPLSNRQFTEIDLVDAAAAAPEHPDRTLFLCWLSFPSTWALEAVQGFENAGGDRVCAVMCDPADYAEQSYPGSWMQYLDDEWGRADAVAIPQWPQATDQLYVYER